MNRSELESLLARVRAAKGPDREMDRDIYEFVKCGRPERTPYVVLPAHYTDSLDAALSLVERVLPPIAAFAEGSAPSSGWKIGIYRGMTPSSERYASWDCMIRKHAGKEDWHSAPTAPLAVLSALLSALLATQPLPEENPHDR